MAERERRQQLAATVATIQARWGPRAIVSAREAARLPVLPSGIAALDEMLGTGGVPQGQLTELIGYGTAGHVRVAAGVLAQAQCAGQQAVYVDVGAQVDVAALSRWGVRLSRLAILRASDLLQGLAMTGDLLRAGYGGAVVFDRLYAQQVSADGHALSSLQQALRDWLPRLSRSSGTLLMLTETAMPGIYPDGLPMPFSADLRLLCERERWLVRRQQIVGYLSRITVLKNRAGTQEGSLTVDITVA